MRTLLGAALVVGVILSASPASAETGSAIKVNCRQVANISAPVVASVSRGETFTVLGTEGTWSRVTLGDGTACWIATRLIADSPQSSDSNAYPYSTLRQSPATRSSSGGISPAPRARQSSAPSRPSRVRESGGSCPCSGSRVCIGPRGGRYCITSGGNKRYGV